MVSCFINTNSYCGPQRKAPDVTTDAQGEEVTRWAHAEQFQKTCDFKARVLDIKPSCLVSVNTGEPQWCSVGVTLKAAKPDLDFPSAWGQRMEKGARRDLGIQEEVGDDPS